MAIECWTFIPLRSRAGDVRAWALIDTADADEINRWRWCLQSGGGYVERRQDRRIVYLHRHLLGLAHGDRRQGDHRNGDPLDNRRRNLRITTPQGNGWNRSSLGRGSSKYRGVSLFRNGRWRAYAAPNGQHHHLGYFDTEDEAAAAVSAFRAERMPSER